MISWLYVIFRGMGQGKTQKREIGCPDKRGAEGKEENLDEEGAKGNLGSLGRSGLQENQEEGKRKTETMEQKEAYKMDRGKPRR